MQSPKSVREFLKQYHWECTRNNIKHCKERQRQKQIYKWFINNL